MISADKVERHSIAGPPGDETGRARNAVGGLGAGRLKVEERELQNYRSQALKQRGPDARGSRADRSRNTVLHGAFLWNLAILCRFCGGRKGERSCGNLLLSPRWRGCGRLAGFCGDGWRPWPGWGGVMAAPPAGYYGREDEGNEESGGGGAGPARGIEGREGAGGEAFGRGAEADCGDVTPRDVRQIQKLRESGRRARRCRWRRRCRQARLWLEKLQISNAPPALRANGSETNRPTSRKRTAKESLEANVLNAWLRRGAAACRARSRCGTGLWHP
jgi:hypothetical protein